MSGKEDPIGDFVSHVETESQSLELVPYKIFNSNIWMDLYDEFGKKIPRGDKMYIFELALDPQYIKYSDEDYDQIYFYNWNDDIFYYFSKAHMEIVKKRYYRDNYDNTCWWLYCINDEIRRSGILHKYF